MLKRVRMLLLASSIVWLAGCTAMMIGGGNGGGYQAPEDQCEEGDPGCRTR